MDNTNGLNKLLEYRQQIETILTDIDAVLQLEFSDEYEVAYQHWIPQIKTALRDNTKWLSRGQFSMDYTLHRINDKLNSGHQKGVSKYI